MRPVVQSISVSVLLTIGSGFAFAAYAADEASGTVEARQLNENFSPQAQYALERREAHAAYADAVKNCKSLSGSDRSVCMKEAQAHLQDDLAYAKQMFNRARQLTENTSPKGRYENSRREAYSAYNQNIRNCGTMTGEDRASCVHEAKEHLQNDLAYAKNQLSESTSVGSSGTAGETGSGAYRGTGAGR